MTDMPEKIWVVAEPDDISADILGDVYAQQVPDGMVGAPKPYIPETLAQALVAAAYQAAGDACGEKEEKYHKSYKDRLSVHCGSSYVEGLSDGMSEAAQEIRALIPSDAQAALDAAIERAVKAERDKLLDVIREAGDVIESYYKTTGIDLGDASRMPFYAGTMAKIEAAIRKDTE